MSKLHSLAFVLLSPLALAACGRGGTVAIELTDAAPILSTLDKVEVSLSKIEVQSQYSCHGGRGDGEHEKMASDDEQEGKWETVNEQAGTFDLLSLQNDVTAPLGEVDVWGEVNRIRMHIDLAGTNQVIMSDGRVCPLDMSAVPSGGVDISHEFEAIDVPNGGRATVVVDFDIEKSLDEMAPCSFALTPVLTIKRVEMEEEVAAE
jgi:hypothetical protein